MSGTFCGVTLQDCGSVYMLIVTDMEVDMLGAKDQIMAEQLGYV